MEKQRRSPGRAASTRATRLQPPALLGRPASHGCSVSPCRFDGDELSVAASARCLGLLCGEL